MQLSDNIKRLLKAILFIIIFLLLTLLFNAAYELDESATEAMLTSYSNHSDLDTVFVGNSAGEMVDSDIFSRLSGNSAFNMCTPSQGLSVSLKNIKLACSHHNINKVILLMTFDTLNSEDYDAIDHLYDRVVDSSSPFHTRIIKSVKRNIEKSFSSKEFVTEHSINLWIPWENETHHGFSNVYSNINRRFLRFINRDPLGSQIAFDLNNVIYDRVPGQLNQNDIDMLQHDISNVSDIPISADLMAEDKLTLLSEICSYCRDNNIELMVIVTPHRSDYLDRYMGFRESTWYISSYLDDFISKRGFLYYNTEEDQNLHTTLPDEYFYDWEHISEEYVEEATDYLAGVIERLENN